MNIFSAIVIAVPAIALVVVAAMLVYALATNVKTGQQVRIKLAERIAGLRYHGMLKREEVDENRLLHSIPLVDIRQEMTNCQSCMQTRTCDQVLKETSPAANDMSFCPNIDAIRKHKLTLQKTTQRS